MPWIVGAAVLGSALIGGVSSYAGGQAQAGAAKDSAALQNQQYMQTREDFAPWRNSGVGALNQINALMGLGGGGAATGGGVSGQAYAPGSNGGGPTPGMLAAQQAAGTRGAGGRDLGMQLATGFLGGKKNNSPIQDISQALALGHPITDAQWAQAGFGPGGAAQGGNALQNPSLSQANPNGGSSIVGYNPDGSPRYGSVNALMVGGVPADAQTAQQNAFNSFRTDPGYQFAFDEGSKALQNSAAARGILNSGATAKALTRYGQGVADQQYGNYFARLQSLAGIGQSATGSTANAGQAAAGNAGNALMAGGNARASAYGGVATSANQGIQNYLLSQNMGGGGYASPNGSGGWNTGSQGFPIYN